ncbi:phage GP46 family protein [Neisseria sp. Dent CA1/247]|uniref:phage GP46 family protein n=1 Tax=Neisseria sp. Dent CA1/247 TaxID=2912675 RepID=UPI001FD31857|nr:phage GP46 family protein [Neisseria sp. Dent CA1/247]UOO76036.1 phage GP46 family protein [Neisseria sp. Dent CA1/247]
MTKLVLDLNKGIPFNLYENEIVGAVILSLFCDARGTEQDGTIGRGWWGDALTDRDEWGSRLWELERSKEVSETLHRAEDAAKDALRWMIDDGICESISITAYSPRREILGLMIKLDNRRFDLELQHAL